MHQNRKISTDEVIKAWRRTWNQHEEEVNRYFANKGNLLRVNIEDRESKKNLILSLRSHGYELSSNDLPYVGATSKRKLSDSKDKSTY